MPSAARSAATTSAVGRPSTVKVTIAAELLAEVVDGARRGRSASRARRSPASARTRSRIASSPTPSA